MNRLRRRARSGFSKGKQSSIVKYLKEISGYPLSVSNFLSLVELTISGNCRQSNLPVGYTEVEYIESSGTQYINTGICPTNNTKVEVVFSADKNSVFVYGSRTQGNTNANHSFCIEGAVNGYFQFGNSLASSSQAVSFNSKHTVIISQDGGYFNGELKQSYDTMSFESTVSMYLCGLNYSGSVDSRMLDGKIYSFRVWESGELIQSLVPCKRDIDGAVGMYDIVTGSFFSNSGTGTFTSGSTSTPSPDNPIDIEPLGEKTGNLYNVNDKYETWNTAVTDDDGWITINYNNAKGTADVWPSLYTNFRDVIEPSTKYTIVTEIEYINDCILFSSTTGSPKSAFNDSFSYTRQGTHYRTVTSESDLSDCVTLLRSIYLVQPGKIASAKFRISLLKGTYTAETIPPYEPYGYKVSGRVEGLNLLDVGDETSTSEAGVTWIINNDGSVTVNGTPTDYSGVNFPRMKAKPNTIYTLSTNIEIPNVVGVINFYDADNTMVATNTGTNSSSMLQAVSPEGTTNVTVGFKRNINNVAIPETTFYPMLLQGAYTADTIPPYEPYQPSQEFAVYLPQQLAKVGDVADMVVVDFEKRTAELVQNCFEYYVTGEENTVAPGGNGSGNCYGFALPIDRKGRATPMLSDRYQIAYTSVITPLAFDDVTIIIGGMGEHVYFYLPFTKYTDLDTFKTYLQEQNNAGDPITILCIRNTPVTTDITAMQNWDAMPSLWEGSMIITLESDIEPSNLNLKYYSSVE